jgi:hypothetical protein
VKLTLQYNPTATDQPATLTDLVLKLFEKVNGFKKLVLIGNIKDDLRDRLATNITRGPFSPEVADYLAAYHFLAKRAFDKGHYDAAR